MRILALVLTLMVLAVPGVTALAAEKPGAGAPAVPARPTPLPLAEGSALAGLGFGDKPFLLGDSPTFSSVMAQAAHDLQRACGPLEVFGWEIKGDDQRRVDMLTGSLIGALKKNGLVVQQVKPKSLQNTEVMAYTGDGNGRNLLLLLSLSPPPGRDQLAQLVLLICDTTRNRKN